MTARKNTSIRRAFSMASMGADIAGSYLGYALQRAFLGETKSRQKLKSTHTRAARRMRDEMQALRILRLCVFRLRRVSGVNPKRSSKTSRLNLSLLRLWARYIVP
jgi:hypothetical protein